MLASVCLIDSLEAQISEINARLAAGGADHPYVPRLLSVPGIGSVLAFTIAAEIGEISRFPSATKLTGYPGLCPRVVQSGESDRAGRALIAVVEAKKVSLGPQNVLTQAERYAERLHGGAYATNGYVVPFIYSTNGEVIWFETT